MKNRILVIGECDDAVEEIKEVVAENFDIQQIMDCRDVEEVIKWVKPVIAILIVTDKGKGVDMVRKIQCADNRIAVIAVYLGGFLGIEAAVEFMKIGTFDLAEYPDASGISLHPEFFQMLERASKYVASLDEEEIQSKEPEKSLQNPIG